MTDFNNGVDRDLVTDRDADPAEYKKNVLESTRMIEFLRAFLKHHMDEATDGDVWVPFNARGMHDLRDTLEVTLRDGAGCGPEEIAGILAGNYRNL